MPSKKSFFNRTLFRKNMSRFWPLWGGASLVGSLLPLYMLMALLSGAARHLDALEFSYALYMTAAAVGPSTPSPAPRWYGAISTTPGRWGSCTPCR